MSDHTLDGVKPEQVTQGRAGPKRVFECANTVRTYNSAPGRITLQVRGYRSYANASLTRDQVSKLIECLHDCLSTCIPE